MGVVVIDCGGRGVPPVVVKGPYDLGFRCFIDTSDEFVNGDLEEGVGGGVSDGVGGMGVYDSYRYGTLISRGFCWNLANENVVRKSRRSDCQRYGIFNGVADNVDKYS